jgi:hypothetical protein
MRSARSCYRLDVGAYAIFADHASATTHVRQCRRRTAVRGKNGREALHSGTEAARMPSMKLRALLLQVCIVAALLAVAALPSVAWAHGSHEHGTEHAGIAGNLLHKGTPAQAFAGPGDDKGAALSRTAAPEIPCNGACCGTGCCGGCTMALADNVSQVLPVIVAGTRIPPPDGVDGPGTVPEALPKPPKSFA